MSTRLIKLLNMIGSNQDGEALSAARMAHSIAKASGGWEELLSGAVDVGPDSPSDASYYEMVRAMLVRTANPKASKFLASLQQWYWDHDFYTVKQRAAIDKFYNNFKGDKR